MRTVLAALLGSVIGGAVAVVLGSAEAIREANTRALQAREIAQATIERSEIQGDTITRLNEEVARLKADLL